MAVSIAISPNISTAPLPAAASGAAPSGLAPIGGGTELGSAFASLADRMNAQTQSESTRQTAQLADTVTSIGGKPFQANLPTPRYGAPPSMSEGIAKTATALAARPALPAPPSVGTVAGGVLASDAARRNGAARARSV